MTNKVYSNGRYDEQIADLAIAIELLSVSDNQLGFQDDGSGKEYTSLQHRKGLEAKEHAINSIQKALNVLINEGRMS